MAIVLPGSTADRRLNESAADAVAALRERPGTEVAPAEMTAPLLPPVDTLRVPFLSGIPLLGPPVFDQSPYFFVMLVLAALIAIVLHRSCTGLKIAAAGERPEALLLAGGADYSSVPAELLPGVTIRS